MSGPSSCRRCAGPLPSPDGDGNAVCPSCGLFHHEGDGPDPVAAPPGPFGAGASAPPAAPTPAAARRDARKGVGCAVSVLVGLVALAGIVVGIVATVRTATDDGGGGLELTVTTGDSEVVTDAAGRPVELVGLAQPTGDSERVVARTSIDGEVAWEARVVPGDVYSAQFRTTDDLVLASLGDEVVALDRATGAVGWRVTVSDEVDPRCRDCFALLDGHLVVLSRDAHVTVVDLADGARAWTRRLESARGTVRVVAGTLLVLDEPAGGPAALVRTAVATGAEEGRIEPSCPDPDDPAGVGRAVDFEVGSLVVPVPGTDDVVLAFGFGEVCVQRWTVPTGERRWSHVVGELTSLFDPTVTVDERDLVISDGTDLVHVGLSEGTVSPLALPLDTTPTGAAVLVEGRLVTAVESTRGTTRARLLAVDLRDRSVRWERDLPRDHAPCDLGPRRSSDTLFEGDACFVLAPRGDGQVALVTFASPGARLTEEGVDVATGRGVLVGRTSFALRWARATSPSVRVEAVTGGRLVFTSESIPQVLDLATGEVVADWSG